MTIALHLNFCLDFSKQDKNDVYVFRINITNIHYQSPRKTTVKYPALTVYQKWVPKSASLPRLIKSATLPPPPWKWKFATFKSSWTLEFKLPLYPRPSYKNGKLAFWNRSRVQDFLDFKSATIPPPPPPPPHTHTNAKLAFLDRSQVQDFRFQKCHFTFPPRPQNAKSKLVFLDSSGLQILNVPLYPLPSRKCTVGIFGQILNSGLQISKVPLYPELTELPLLTTFLLALIT